MSYKLLFTVAFFWFASDIANAQLVPAKPELYYVTVDIETGNDIIFWNPSPSNNVSYYIIAVPYYNPVNPFYELTPIGQTLDSTVHFYINPNTESSLHSMGYTVWARNDLGGGSYYDGFWDDPPDSTIYLNARADSCFATIVLSWNDYNTWRGNIREFNIYRRLNPGVYLLLATVDGSTMTYNLSPVNPNETYELFIEAVHQDGVRRSTSNLSTVITDNDSSPAWINADYATISASNTIDLSFTTDANAILSGYELWRGTDLSRPASFSRISTFETRDNPILYTDNVPFTSNIYFYRLNAINDCNMTSTTSNLANNIILNGQQGNLQVVLNWNRYADWQGGVDHYTVLRYDGLNDTQPLRRDVGLNLSFTDDLSGLMNPANPPPSTYCYQVVATERRNAYNLNGTSTSNRVCFLLDPGVRMPNAFIPNDADAVNRIFEPVFMYQPEQYEMVIYNRLGLKIWEGKNTGWDGTVNGEPVAEGIYLYHLRILNYTTDMQDVKGQVTVVYR